MSPKYHVNFTRPTKFRDTFAAQITAKYNTGNLLVYDLLRSLRATTDGYEDEITLHGDSILAAADSQESAGAQHTGCLSMIYPVSRLIVEAISENQRAEAQKPLRRWGKRRGVSRLCEMDPRSHAWKP